MTNGSVQEQTQHIEQQQIVNHLEDDDQNIGHHVPAQLEQTNADDPRLATIQRALDFINEACEQRLCGRNLELSTIWSILLLSRKLFEVRDYLLGQTLTTHALARLKEINHRLTILSACIDKATLEEKADPMGFDLITKIRHLFALGGWNTGKDTQNTLTGAEEAADHDACNLSARKRRQPNLSNDEAVRLLKYRRVDSTFPKYMPNDGEKLMGSKRSLGTSFKPTDTSNAGSDSNQQHPRQRIPRRSIFDAPLTTQRRVRNSNVAVVDLSDDEPNDSPIFDLYAGRTQCSNSSSSGGVNSSPSACAHEFVHSSAAVRPHLLYADAVRHGTNGYMMEQNYARPSSSLSSAAVNNRATDERLNGHGGITWYDACSENAVLQEEQCGERSQYIDLISSMSVRKKPAPPPLQRISHNGSDWQRDLIKSSPPVHVNRPPPPVAITSECVQYAKLIDKQEQGLLPPPLIRRLNISSESLSDNSGVGDHNLCPKPAQAVNNVIELDDDDDDDVLLKNDQSKTTAAPLQCLPQTRALEQRLQKSRYFLTSFEADFSERCARRNQETKHVRSLALKADEKSTEERRALEQDLHLRMARINIKCKPIFILENFVTVSEEKAQELPPLTNEILKHYNELVHGPGNQVLVSKFSLNITRSDISTLIGNRWLNDEVINFYMNLLTDRSERKAGKLPSVYAMNTFFVPRLLQNGHGAVKRWTRKVDLFTKDIIPVPVHVGGVHWCMAIIHMKNKTIRYYDSMGKPNQQVLNALELYLHDESLDKRKQPFDTSDFKIENVANVPHQTNGSDCGVFSCMFAEFITRNKPLTFTQEHMEYFRKKMVLEICEGELWL